jgi:acyl-homoserine-lactone acylase
MKLHKLLRWVGGLAAGLIVVTVAAVIILDHLSLPAEPDTRTLTAPAARYHVRIRRDSWGVPHIKGPRDADVAFGLAYAHAEDDFDTLVEVLLASRGELASVEGQKAAPVDYLVRLLKVRETAGDAYPRLPPEVRAVLEAYADGVNLYAARHHDQVPRGLLPVTGQDIAAGFALKTPFFYGLDDQLRTLTAPRPKLPTGSNGLAVAPRRSSDGATRLLVNSHQPYTGPVAWYEAVLESDEGWHVAGGFFPGSPFMLHGHNAHLGWANTVNAPRLADIYRLTLNPKNPDEYLLDGRWRRFARANAALRVKLLGPLVWTFHKPLEWSLHGPVFRTDHGVFAVRYAGMGEGRQVEQYYRLNKARNRDEWLAAMRLQRLPSINYIYADETGNIGYVYNALFPRRADDQPPPDILPGDRSALIWRTYRSFEEVPQIWNPRSGYVFNANNTPFEATDRADALKPESFPRSMGIQTNMTNRAYRFQETVGADPHISAQAFRTYKFDVAYSLRSTVALLVAKVVAMDPGGDADLAAARDLLRSWDLRMTTDSRAAALAILTTQPIAKDLEAQRMMDVRPALRAAIKTLRAHFGRIDPTWGEVNRIRRGAVDLPIDGGPDTVRAVYGEPQKDGRLKAMAGDTFIMFVTWDRLGRLHSESIHQFGATSANPCLPHYADQTPLFARHETKPVWFTEAELAGHIEADYTPAEAHDRVCPDSGKR